MSAPNPKSLEAAQMAARVLATSKIATISPDLQKTLRAVEKVNFGNRAALAELAKSFDVIRPALAPQIAEALKNYKSRSLMPELADALRDCN